jgi:23S rRNA (cytosine1962-C5)-methyltransferase
MRPMVYLKKSKGCSVKRGHPWIYPKAIMKSTGLLVTGQLVEVVSMDNELVGLGVYNAHSLYRVRLLAYAFEINDTTTLESLVHYRLQQAQALRQALTLPNATTNAYRLFNSEADGLSGLTIDFFNQICVVSSSAYWVQLHKPMILHAIKKTIVCSDVIWLASSKPLAQDGWQQVDVSLISSQIEVLEAGVSYQVHFGHAQKTGLYLDQRENHQRIAALAPGRCVLDLYTYTGGFALHAALAGAKRVMAIDSSASAIIQAQQNAQHNHINNIDFINADARDYLVQAIDYDIVILDPPKLVPSQRHLERAKNYYRYLHRTVLQVMKSGSLLMTCNCSSALSSHEFANLVTSQALMVGRQVRIIGIYGPASCHPTLAAFPEGNYLTAILLAVV